MVVDGQFALLLPDDEQIFAFTRTLADASLLVLANFSSSSAEVPPRSLPDIAGARVLLATHLGATGPSLLPWESRVYLLA